MTIARTTERPSTNKPIRLAALHTDDILDNLPVIVFQRLMTSEGRITYPYISQEGLWLLSNKAGDPPSTTKLWSPINVADRKGLLESLRRSARDLTLHVWQGRVDSGDGSYCWAYTKSKPRRLANGDTLWVGVLIDVTEQKTIEEELRQREEMLERHKRHLSRAQRMSHIGSAEINVTTGALEWSDELYRMYGQDKESFRPTLEAVKKLIHPEDLDRWQARLDIAFRGEIPEPDQYRIIRPDGEVRILYRDIDLIHDREGRLNSIIVTKRDITDRLEADREREELKQSLIYAQRMDSLGRLAGGIAHDLNNTLVPVVALSEAVRRNLGADSADSDLLQIVREAGERARDLVRQILTFSRHEPPDMKLIDVVEFVNGTIRFVRASIPTTIKIEARLAEVPKICADVAQLHQVLLNLFANAADAIGSATGQITIELARTDYTDRDPRVTQRQEAIRLSVIDSGCGMDENTASHIFEPFFTTKSVDKGTGLGLAVVYGIITSHGGRVQVTSAPGKGARFDIYLPVTGSEDQERDAV